MSEGLMSVLGFALPLESMSLPAVMKLPIVAGQPTSVSSKVYGHPSLRRLSEQLHASITVLNPLSGHGQHDGAPDWAEMRLGRLITNTDRFYCRRDPRLYLFSDEDGHRDDFDVPRSAPGMSFAPFVSEEMSDASCSSKDDTT